MTKRELSQLHWLNRELAELRRKLRELEVAATGCTTKITGMPGAFAAADKTGNFAAEIADTKALIERNIRQSFCELNRLNGYIQAISEPYLRLIFSLRFINGLHWRQIAFEIGGGNTEDSVRMAADRYLARKPPQPI